MLRVDLEAFFSSVFAGRVYGVFRTPGYPEEVARTLTALCTHRPPADVLARLREQSGWELARLRAPHLPQGAPTSGALANLVAYRLDVRVEALARSIGAQYTRYADDLVLSGERELARAANTILARVGAIAIEEGFAVNHRKTRVMTASRCQRITGLVVNERPSAGRREIEHLRAVLHNCRRTGPREQNRDGVRDFQAHLRGRIEWVARLEPAKGARLHAMFDQIDWSSEPQLPERP